MPPVASFKPMGKKRALLIAIRSVLRSDLPNLDLAHRDAKALFDHLMNAYDYQPDDIILMLDDKRHPKHLWPTRRKILHQIDQLTHDVPEGCRFFFYFSGHCLQEASDERASVRADGLEDEIVCADGKPILDYILHDRLIAPLENVVGSKLFALLDCGHSESLLDFQRGRGPNSYSRTWNVGRDQLFRAVAISIARFMQLYKRHRRNNPPSPGVRSTDWNCEQMPVAHAVGELSVVCLSACRDSQLAHDDMEQGLTFTKCFMDATAINPNITWTELRDTLKGFISQIWERSEQGWTQEPRISTSLLMDLTQKVTDFICDRPFPGDFDRVMSLVLHELVCEVIDY